MITAQILGELQHRFAYHAPTPAKILSHESVRNACHEAAKSIVGLCPPCAETTLATRKLEEAMYWANAAIARNPEKTP